MMPISLGQTSSTSGFGYATALEQELQVWIIDHILTSDQTLS